MTETRQSIPTTYRGINMRSRLEAKWAAYFDLRGDTIWEYEPVDFPGWIPDFTIKIEGTDKPFILEVKPVSDLESFIKSDDSRKMANAILKNIELMHNFFGPVLAGTHPKHMWFLDQGVWRPPAYKTNSWNEELWAKASNIVQWNGRSAS